MPAHSLSRIVLPLCCLIFFCMSRQVSYSQNLVPNSDFDEHSWCPIGRGLLGWAIPWYSPNRATTDFCHTCAGSPSFSGVPVNRWGSQWPYKGNGYAGIRTWISTEVFVEGRNYREYLAVVLTDTMVAGETYKLSFKVSAGDHAAFFTDDVGMYISHDSIPSEGLLPFSPHLANPEGALLNNMTDWIEIAGQYVATGGERHLVIGNFKDDEHTTLVARNSDEDLMQTTYLYIDDVRVEGCAVRFPEQLIVAADTLLCPGEILTLEAVQLDSASYEWEDGSSELLYKVSEAKIYSLKVNIDGCVRTDSIRIQAVEIPMLDLGADTVLCEGEFLQLETQAVADAYLWSDNSTNTSLRVSESGTYNLRITKEDCMISDDIRVSFLKTPATPLPFDTLVCQGSPTTLSPFLAGFNYRWPDGSEASTFQAQRAGSYWVDVSSQCFSIRQFFTIQEERCSCESFIPNVFTPNHDGINDQFIPKLTAGGISRYQLHVFDRYGINVFSTNDPNSAWTGINRGKKLPEGIYYWVLTYDCREAGKNFSKLRKGHLSLFR